MQRLVFLLLSVVALMLFAGNTSADMISPGSCFGDNGHEDSPKRDSGSDGRSDSGGDGKLAQGATRPSTRQAGFGLVSAAFLTSGWLVFRRQDRKR